MSEFTIDSLPEEVLIEVFKLLDSTALKSVVLTCKKWKDIAEQHIPWSLKLPCSDRMGETSGYEMLLSSQRMYKKLNYTGSLNNESWQTDVVQKLAPKITSLNLFVCDTEVDLQVLMKRFSLFQNLKKLNLCYSTLLLDLYSTFHSWPDSSNVKQKVDEVIADSDLPLFLKLQELSLKGSNAIISLKIFKKAQLTSLSVGQLYFPSRFIEKELMNFLSTQKSLKKLTLNLPRLGFKLPIDEVNIPFELKKLSLVEPSSSTDQSFNLDLLELQSKSIETLRLSSRNFVPDVIFELVLAKFKNLKTLLLDCRVSPQSLNRLEVNTSVTTVSISDKADSAINQLLKHLPNIENLEIFGRFKRKTLESIAENLKKLKTLKLGEFHGHHYKDLNIPSLRALSIGYVDGALNSLATAAPGITHLHFFCSKNTKYFIKIEQLLQKLKLESLTINSSISADKKFFDAVRKYGSSLKSLNLTEQSRASVGPNVIQISELIDILGLCFLKQPMSDPLATVFETKKGDF